MAIVNFGECLRVIKNFMLIKKDIISKRYVNDGISLVKLNNVQKNYLNLFLNDNRIKYKTISECPLCKDMNSFLIAEKERYAIPLETVVCENCGLVRSYKQLDEESSKIFYSEYYRKIYEEFTNLDNDLLNERYGAGAKRKIPKYITKDKIVLEIGCGGGWNLMSFHKKGYKYYGFDFDKDFTGHGKERGLNLHLGGIDEAIKMGIRCDYLLINQVLEHVDNPIGFLVSLKPALNDNAVINILVPSLDLLLWGYANCDLLRTLQNAHNFLFDEFTLKSISVIAGFETINCVATNLVLKNSENITDSTPDIAKLNRGRRIVKYLKFVEKTLSLRKKVGLEKGWFKKLYCIVRPTGCYKRFLMDCLGRI